MQTSPSFRTSSFWKWLTSGAFVCASIIYVIWQNTEQRPLDTLHATAVAATQSTPVATTTASEYHDGTYTGDAVNAYYGIVQVQAVVETGKLTDITLLQQPDDRPQTVSVSKRSLPTLIQEALQIQSADVHGVSGATQTSEGFQASLGSALAQAKA